MGGPPLNFSLSGDLAEAVRRAAVAAGVSPAVWVGRVLRAELSPPEGTTDQPGPDPAASPDRWLADPRNWERVTDPSGSFTALLPRGWNHETRLVQGQSGPLSHVATSSPDDRVRFLAADTSLPSMFIVPGPFALPMPGAQLRPPTPAEQFAEAYVRERLGPQARVHAVRHSPGLLHTLQERIRTSGLALSWGTAAELVAESGSGSGALAALVTCAGTEQAWFAQVSTVTAPDPALAEALLPALARLVGEVDATPKEKQRQQQEQAMRNQQHRATMDRIQANTAMMTQQHQQNLANIQASGMAHQARMADLQASHDARFAGWQEQQASSDRARAGYLGALRQDSPALGSSDPGGRDQHLDFLNMITEQRTVVDHHGHEHQVEAGHDRYYYREYDNSWIALDQHQDIHDVPGINPDDYREARIRS